MTIRAIDTHDGLLAEMFTEPHGLFVSLDDLLVYLDGIGAKLADTTASDPLAFEQATPAQVIATLAQDLAANFNVVSS